jgi:beta-N-acetylhexosaminidase
LPHGLSGLVIAAIFAAAMSNLSGSLNSLSSTTVLDLYKPLINPNASDESLLKLSRWLTAAWGVVLIAIAILARSWGSVFTTGLTIASLVYGPMLGAFLLGVLSKRANQRGVIAGMGLSLVFMLVIYSATSVAWTWYVLMGTIVCLSTGYAFSLPSTRKFRHPAVVGMLLITLFVLHGLALSGSQTYAPFAHKLTKKEDRWVRQTMAAFTLDEKIGQMMTVSTNAVFMNREGDEYRKLRHQIVDNKVGGVILFRSEVWATAILTNRLQEMAKVPLLVSSDLEMGPGMRLDDTTWWAPNMAVAATNDVRYARLQGSYTAREARAAGINWLYAPVVDVNNNPDNPVINTRSYGEDPQRVAAFAAAFIEGAQAAGALATAKHFPGHGDTAIDSHLGLPVIDVTRDRLDRLELVPFRAAIAAGAGSIMTAHIALPQIEPEPAAPLRAPGENGGPRLTLPATLSHTILTGLLRENLSFQGLIVTDSMTMAGVAARYDGATSAVMAIKAGADMVLIPPDVDAAIRAVKQAVERGEIAESRISASVERILRAKAALGLSEHRTIDIQEVDRVVSGSEFNGVAQDIADRSITLVRDEKKSVPFAKTKLLAVAVIDEDNRNNTIQPFLAELRHSGVEVQAVTIDNRSSDKDVERALSRIDQSDAVVYCMLIKGALPPSGRQLAEELGKIHGTAIAISFGNPYLLTAMPGVPAYMAAYSPHPVSQRAAARALSGTIDITGTLPVSLPGLYPQGHGLTVTRR